MTIHKSKGLEFPVVIFPFAEENYSLQKKDKLWVDFTEENFGLSKVLLHNNKSLEGFGEVVK
jgi:ATP-dependent exoDNAse (exonuclease V) beta subunit